MWKKHQRSRSTDRSESINQSINQSTNQSINQSIRQAGRQQSLNRLPPNGSEPNGSELNGSFAPLGFCCDEGLLESAAPEGLKGSEAKKFSLVFWKKTEKHSFNFVFSFHIFQMFCFPGQLCPIKTTPQRAISLQTSQ